MPVISGPCDAVNDMDLDAITGCYYKSKTTGKACQILGPNVEHCSSPFEAKVIGTDQRDGAVYARVSISYHRPLTGNKCSLETLTETWTQEQGHWRLINQPQLQEVAKLQMASGDYQSAAESYAKLLEHDPFSVAAYEGLALAIGSRGASLPGKSMPDIVRGVLGINPIDSTAVFIAATHVPDSGVAGMFIDNLDPTDCQYAWAVFNVAFHLKNPNLVIAFLDKHPPKYEASGLTMLRIGALAELRKKDALRLLLTEQTLDSIRQELASRDASFAGYWAASTAKAFLLIGDVRAAQELVSVGLRRDPSSKTLSSILRKIHSRTK